VVQAWVVAIGLVLILEGIGPFAAPGRWRQIFETIAKLTDGQLRFYGLASLLLGLAILVIARTLF
jgi:uncharacterized protein YjeT (DUF2065 family)